MRFTILTYNVLHSAGAKRLLRGRSHESARWSVDRLQRAAEMVMRLAPDVACFQEFDVAAAETFERTLEKNYTCAIVLRNEALPPQDGCAVFLRSPLMATQSHAFRLRDVAQRHFPASLALRTGAGYAAALWREVHEKLTLAVALEVTTQSGRFWVATSHLFWDPKYPDLKLLQAWLLERELTALMGDDQPLILAGDLNSTPLLDGRSQGSAECECSGVYELLTRGKVEVSHPHHPVMLRPGSGILKGIQPEDVPEFQLRRFRSAQVEAGGGERATNVSADFVGCLDYILYRGEPLRLLRTRAMEELPRNAVLPSEEHPSDHLPLLAEFELDGSWCHT